MISIRQISYKLTKWRGKFSYERGSGQNIFGYGNILVLPDIMSGNLLLKALSVTGVGNLTLAGNYYGISVNGSGAVIALLILV